MLVISGAAGNHAAANVKAPTAVGSDTDACDNDYRRPDTRCAEQASGVVLARRIDTALRIG